MSHPRLPNDQSGYEIGAVNPDELAQVVVELLRSFMRTSLASAALEGTEILGTLDDVHSQWLECEWDEVRSLCRDGVEFCVAWKDNSFSYLPVLAQGVLYIYAGSCELLGKRAEGWGEHAIRAFRNGRECLRNLMHMDGNAFEATACLGLSTAYYVCGQYELAAHASSNGLTMLPHNHPASYWGNPDPLPDLQHLGGQPSGPMASNTLQLREHLKCLHDWARLKRGL